jgi:hypothetical protein
MLVTTSTANKLIADVWFARADFANDNPDVMEGFARGIFDAMVDLKTQDAKQRVAKLMGAGYSIPESDALGMLGDSHSTNYAENRDFFVNQNNPTSFERTWSTAYFLYKKINAVTEQTPFDQVIDFTVIQKLGAEPPYCFLSSQLTSVMTSIFRKPGFWSKAEKYTYRTSSGVSSEWSTGTPDSLSFQPEPAFSLANARGWRPPLGGFVPSNATHNQNSGLEPLLGNH